MGTARPFLRWLILLAMLAALTLLLALPGASRAPRASPAAGTDVAVPPAIPSPTTPPAEPDQRLSPARRPSPTPAPHITASATTSPLTITFALHGELPAGASEALLWYDTTAGHAIRRIPLNGARTISASVTITPTQEGLTLTHALDETGSALDYWWAVRDQAGATIRATASLTLPEALAAGAQTEPITAPAELTWVERATPHFRLYAPPGSAAARDLDRLALVAEASYDRAAAVLALTEPVSIPVYLVPRVFWQGGLAFQDGPLVIAHLDRNYVALEPWAYFVHEVTHALSDRLLPRGGEVGGLLGEGLAVYATGGHYGLEPIDAWAAALAESDRYVPLCQLRYDFYSAQHEIAYQEGASFVAYLIRTYGLDAFKQIYAAQRPQRGEHKVDVAEFCATDNQRIIAPTGKTAGELEQDWLAYLKTIHPTSEQRRAWELTVRFFDTMRHYQEALDPPARELPPPPAEWDRATAAKFLNPASGRRAAVLETMLGAAGGAIRRGELDHGAALLDAIESSLALSGTLTSPPARDYAAIVDLVAAQARALRRGDDRALARTLASPTLATALPFTTRDLLHDLRFTPVELDVRGDTAEGVVSVDGTSLDGRRLAQALYRARFARSASGWRMTTWEPHPPAIELPPGHGEPNAPPL